MKALSCFSVHAFSRMSLLAVLLVVSGCGIVTGVVGVSDAKDLKLLSVRVIDERGLPPWWFNRFTASRDAAPLLELQLSTERDLRKIGEIDLANLFQLASICRGGEYDPVQRVASFGVYDDLGLISLQPDPGSHLADPSAKLRRYRVFVLPRTHARAAFRPGEAYIDHDLRTATDDICVQIRGGSMLGGTFRTNTVVIPHAAIRAALDQAGL